MKTAKTMTVTKDALSSIGGCRLAGLQPALDPDLTSPAMSLRTLRAWLVLAIRPLFIMRIQNLRLFVLTELEFHRDNVQ